MKSSIGQRITAVMAIVAVWTALSAQTAKAAPKGEDAWVEMESRVWSPTLRGFVQSSQTASLGTNVNVADVLGMDTQQRFYWPKATLHFADRHRLSVSLLDMHYAGDKMVNIPFTFGGTTFILTDRIHSQLEFKEVVGGYQYDFLKFSGLAASLNLQAHYLDIHAEVRSAALGTAKEDLQAPVPTIGGGIQFWPTDWLKLNADCNIFKMGIPGFRGEMIDTQGAVTVSPWDWLGISAGYRYYRIIVRDTDQNDRADWLQKGPYLAIVGRF
jgi:hypothetical protein